MYQGAEPYCLLSNPWEMRKGDCVVRKCLKMYGKNSKKGSGCKKYNIGKTEGDKLKKRKGKSISIKK